LGVRSLLFREEEEATEQQMYWEIGKSKERRPKEENREANYIGKKEISLGIEDSGK